MNAITVRLPDQLFKELDDKSKKLKISRTLYVRKALERLNQEIDVKQRQERLKEISLKVRSESLKVNAEFSEVEDAPDA